MPPTISRKKRVFLGLILGVVLAGGITIGLWVSKPITPLPILGVAPTFILTDSQHAPFSSQELKGKIWVLNFMFTHCAGPCPVMSDKMAFIHRSYLLEPGVYQVSVSVDPVRDTPAALTMYAKRFKADINRWHFLTGPEKTVRSLVTGLKLATPNQPLIQHSVRFVLIDPTGHVRGYYNGVDQESINQLFKDISTLQKEPVQKRE